MPRLAPLALVFALAACGSGPLSVIPPAELALMSAQIAPLAPAEALPDAVEGAGMADGMPDPVTLAFRAALCAQALAAQGPLPADCAAPAAGPAAVAAGDGAAPVVAPAAISIDAMLARVRGESTEP